MSILAFPTPVLGTEAPSLKTFGKGSYLPPLSDRLWQIEAGVVRTLSINRDGIPIPLGFWGSSDVVGSSLSQSGIYEMKCLTEVQAKLVNHQDVTAALMRHIDSSQKMLEILHERKILQALLHLLAWLAQRFGHRVGSEIWIGIPFTHQELAETLGSTRVTITRLLQRLEQEGQIRRSARKRIALSPRLVHSFTCRS